MSEQEWRRIRPLTREQIRDFKKMNVADLGLAMEKYGTRLANIGYNRGIEQAALSMFMALKDEFGFGSKRIGLLMDKFVTILKAVDEGEFDAEDIRKQLLDEGVKSLERLTLLKR